MHPPERDKPRPIEGAILDDRLRCLLFVFPSLPRVTRRSLANYVAIAVTWTALIDIPIGARTEERLNSSTTSFTCYL